jgi:hypothetical protein
VETVWSQWAYLAMQDYINGEVGDEGRNVIVGKDNRQSDNHVNFNNYGNSPIRTPTLEQRVERLEKATFGDDVIGLYGVIRQQQKQTLWLQILTGLILSSEIVRYWVL